MQPMSPQTMVSCLSCFVPFCARQLVFLGAALVLLSASIPSRADDPSPVFDVRSYGATGTGGDDYPGILMAVNALKAHGSGTLFFPGGYTYRVQTPGVHGVRFTGVSNFAISFGADATLVMDNMVAGLAVSHGVFIEGPCQNVTLRNVSVKYASMSVVRQGWAPIFCLGANVGNGVGGWLRGAADGHEDPAGIAAGAIKNLEVIGCRSESSPSVMIGLVGIDGVTVTNFTGIQSWADGLYHLNFRNATVTGVNLTNVGDDGVSFSSYESDLANADILNDFHGEGSVVSDVTISGLYPAIGYPPAGSVAFLGVRDIDVSNVTATGKYRGIRFEMGTETTGPLASLNINLLANRNITISNVTLTDCTQAISVVTKEVDFTDDEKWWRNDVAIDGVTITGGDYPFDVSADPILTGKTLPRIMCGFSVSDVTATGYSQSSAALNGPVDCAFADIVFSGAFTFAGYVPWGGDPNQATYRANDSSFENIKGQDLTFLGLKNVWLDNIESNNAYGLALNISTSADVSFGTLKVVNTNRGGVAWPGGLLIDEYSHRVTGATVLTEQDTVDLPNLVSINSKNAHSIALVKIQTQLDKYYNMVWDKSLGEDAISQITRIEWYHGGQSIPEWRYLDFP